jgi:hypothetical protein
MCRRKLKIFWRGAIGVLSLLQNKYVYCLTGHRLRHSVFFPETACRSLKPRSKILFRLAVC